MKEREAVLLVEPDDEYAAQMETLLRQVGWSADREVDGAAALREASETEYALALVDSGVMLDSGVSLLRELRSATSIPRIALSGEEDGESAVRRAIEHADYELVRPFSPRRFRAAVRTVTSRGRLTSSLAKSWPTPRGGGNTWATHAPSTTSSAVCGRRSRAIPGHPGCCSPSAARAIAWAYRDHAPETVDSGSGRSRSGHAAKQQPQVRQVCLEVMEVAHSADAGALG